MVTIKLEIERFDYKISFTTWQFQMKMVLVQQGLKQATIGKPDDMAENKWLELDKKAYATISLSLSKEVLREVMNETAAKGVWETLQTL